MSQPHRRLKYVSSFRNIRCRCILRRNLRSRPRRIRFQVPLTTGRHCYRYYRVDGSH